MDLSVVIVNYNVRYFLEQCLQSVYRAGNGITMEVFVVDNNSQDGSVEMVREKFPQVQLIANSGNPGFSKANNQAMALAKGQYVLILNPDTVVAEDTFGTCIRFMEEQTACGALGVKMIDGKGVFLPESKRGLPTPAVAFYKMFGMAALFPASKIFGQYHLGFLSKEESHEVEILSGAFMFFRKKVLDEIGFFDETFFMYGEDIDLSYRVIKGGYKNYYLADTTIIHYKGESTKKGSLNYVKVFYEAMIIFARKHFAARGATVFSILIHLAVVFRAVLTVIGGLLASGFLILLDALLIYGGTFGVIKFWASNIKNAPEYYPLQFLGVVVPLYVFTWTAGAFFSGGYERPFQLRAILKGVLLATVLIAAWYAFLPESWRFSRAIILLGAVVAVLAMVFTRVVYNLVRLGKFSFDATAKGDVLIVGTGAAAATVQHILQQAHADKKVAVVMQESALPLMPDYLRTFPISEMVFSTEMVSFKNCIALTASYGQQTDIKFLNPGVDALIGSNSKNTAGDLYAGDLHLNLARPLAYRKKRLLDITCCVLMLPLLPLLVATNKSGLLQHWWLVVTGKMTWVGYDPQGLLGHLPKLPAAVLYSSCFTKNTLPSSDLKQLNLRYAKDYTISNDLAIIWQGRSKLGGV
ncbi:MAG: glycosyltransferase [Chitinophagales bacterium]